MQAYLKTRQQGIRYRLFEVICDSYSHLKAAKVVFIHHQSLKNIANPQTILSFSEMVLYQFVAYNRLSPICPNKTNDTINRARVIYSAAI